MAGLMECGHVKEALSTTVHAMSMCRTFYLSYVYTHVRPLHPQSMPLLSKRLINGLLTLADPHTCLRRGQLMHSHAATPLEY